MYWQRNSAELYLDNYEKWYSGSTAREVKVGQLIIFKNYMC